MCCKPMHRKAFLDGKVDLHKGKTQCSAEHKKSGTDFAVEPVTETPRVNGAFWRFTFSRCCSCAFGIQVAIIAEFNPLRDYFSGM